MESCSSRQKVLILDCCYSGAFPVGSLSKADSEVHTLERFRGKGRVVLTASDATQYSFEGNAIAGQGTRSVFTRVLVEGLASGDADLDDDGDITLDDLYEYVYDRVVREMPQQRPKKQDDIEGRIVLARNIHWSLPRHLRSAVESPIVNERLAALDGLTRLYRIGNHQVRADAVDHIRRLVGDPDRAVSRAATALMRTIHSDEIGQTKERAAEQPVVRRRLARFSADFFGVRFLVRRRNHDRSGASRRSGSPSVRPGTRRRTVLIMSAVLVVPLVLAVFAAVEGLTRWTALPPTTHDTGDYVSVIDDPAPRIDDPGPRVITDTLVGDSPRGVAITGDGRRVFVCNFFSDDVSVIDAVGNTVVTTLPVGDYLWDKNRPWDKAMPLGISVVPAGKKFAPDGYKAYVANHGSDTVSVIKIGEG